MSKQFNTMEFIEQCDGVPSGTACVLLDELAGGSVWIVECFDGTGETIDVITVPIATLRPLRQAASSRRTAA